MEGLQVFPERMRQNLDLSGGLAFSQGVLLALIDAGLSRDEAYGIVQRAAAAAWDEGGDFQDALLQDNDVKVRLSPQVFESLFDPTESVKNLDAVFDRLEKLEIAG
jgi:adenylosuccinate lyase